MILDPREGVCGICHAVAEEVCKSGGKIMAYEQLEGVIARIFDEGDEIIGEGLDIVWSSAVLAAEIDAGLIPDPVDSDVKREGTSSREDIERVADLYGYGKYRKEEIRTWC